MSEKIYYKSTAHLTNGKEVNICYRKTFGIFAPSIYSDDLYFYKENGKFYEFFSGLLLAEKENENGTLLIPESFLLVRTKTEISWGKYNYYTKSASSFADEVKKYMPSQKSIAKQIQCLLKDSHDDWIIEKKQREAEEYANKIKEKNSKSWLDDVISSRK